MDEVLTRPLFRDAYLQTVKKKTDDGILSVYKFQKGGEVFTEAEKQAILASPFIESLAGATIGPGETKATSLIKALTKGAGDLGSQILNIKKLEIAGRKEGKDRTIITRMSPDEIKAEGLPPGTIAERKTLITGSGALLNQGYDIKKQSDIAKLQDDITKKQIPELDAKIQDVFTKFLPYVQKGQSIPGIGVGGSLMVPFSQEARENRDSVAGIRNALLKIGAGTAQSKQETENIMQELAGGLFRTEEEFLKAIDRINARVNKEKQAIFAGYSDEEVKAFTEKTGLGIKESLASLAKKTGGQKNEVPLEPGLPTFTIEKGVLKRK